MMVLLEFFGISRIFGEYFGGFDVAKYGFGHVRFWLEIDLATNDDVTEWQITS